MAGAPDGKNSKYTYPSEVEADLENEFDYQVTNSHRLSVDCQSTVKEILDLINHRSKTVDYLFSEYDADFLQVTTFYLNSLHHFLWDSEYTFAAWQTIDKHLGNYLNEGYNVVLMSDYGSTQIETTFNVNSWLETEGYLTLNAATSNLLYRTGITTDRLIVLESAFDIQEIAERFVSRWLFNCIPNKSGEFNQKNTQRGLGHNECDCKWTGTNILECEPVGTPLRTAADLN